LWQLLLKGYEEVRSAPDPLVAAKMALLRALHAADMPDPGRLAKELQALALNAPATNAPATNAPATNAPATNAPATPAAAGASETGPAAALEWADLAAAIRDCPDVHHSMSLYSQLQLQVRVITLEEGKLIYAQPPEFEDDLTPALKQALFTLTGQRWAVATGTGHAAPSLVEQEAAALVEARKKIEHHPMIKATKDHFPGAEIIEEKDPPHTARNWSRRA